MVRAVTIAWGLVGGLKQFISGNIPAYADVCESARGDACRLMVQNALEVQAEALIAKQCHDVARGARDLDRQPEGGVIS